MKLFTEVYLCEDPVVSGNLILFPSVTLLQYSQWKYSIHSGSALTFWTVILPRETILESCNMCHVRCSRKIRQTRLKLQSEAHTRRRAVLVDLINSETIS